MIKKRNLIDISAAKDACKSLVFIAERTDDEALQNTCMETIKHLCKSFDITIFGSLPDYSNGRLPRSTGVSDCLGTDV